MKNNNQGYNGNPNLPKAGNKIHWTPHMIDEYARCMDDPVYFMKTYMKIVHIDKGVVPFDLYDFQEEIVNAYPNNRNMILCQSRQSGKSTVVVGIILHYCLFNKDKTAAILANKLDQALELMERIQLAYEYLPDFLKDGVAVWNKKSVKFGNGTKIMAAASSSSAIRGKSCSLVYIDEHAFIPRWEEFSASVLPVLSSGKESRLILSSTPNGLNQFYTYMEGAKAGTNGFWWIEVPWDRVPGRDEEWKQKVLGDINHDLIKFAQEYECVEYSTRVFIESNGSVFMPEIGEIENIDTSKTIEENYDGIFGVVYCLTRSDGLKYIGVTKDINRRIWTHKKSPRFQSHTILDVEILMEGAYIDCLREEPNFIAKYDTHKNGLNKTASGGALHDGHFTNIGQRHSESTKEKMRVAKTKSKYKPPKGRSLSEDTKRKLSESRKGKSFCIKIPADLKQNIREEFRSYIITKSDIESCVAKKYLNSCSLETINEIADKSGMKLSEFSVKLKVLYRKYNTIMSRTHYRNIVKS